MPECQREAVGRAEDKQSVERKRVSCIILNYNDADTTSRLVESIRNYRELSSIVIVDNASTDDSVNRLKALAGGHIHLVQAEKNGGYGAGNNVGIRYAVKNLRATHVLIANPDVQVSQACIRAMIRVFGRVERCAVVSAVVKDRDGHVQLSSWKLHGLLGDLLDTGLVTRRIFSRFLNDRPELHTGRNTRTRSGRRRRTWRYVDAVCGSLFMADAAVLQECGWFDENVFLYYEEKILGHRLKEREYLTVLLLNQSYIHLHSVSIDKSVTSILKKQELLHESKMYYYKTYLRIGPVAERVASLTLRGLLREIWFLTEVLRVRW